MSLNRGAVMTAVVVGVVSGIYIYDEPLRRHAEDRRRAYALGHCALDADRSAHSPWRAASSRRRRPRRRRQQRVQRRLQTRQAHFQTPHRHHRRPHEVISWRHPFLSTKRRWRLTAGAPPLFSPDPSILFPIITGNAPPAPGQSMHYNYCTGRSRCKRAVEYIITITLTKRRSPIRPADLVHCWRPL